MRSAITQVFNTQPPLKHSSNHPLEIVKEVTVLKKELKSSGHRVVRCMVGLNLRREREKLINKETHITLAIRERADEFKLDIEKKILKTQ